MVKIEAIFTPYFKGNNQIEGVCYFIKTSISYLIEELDWL